MNKKVICHVISFVLILITSAVFVSGANAADSVSGTAVDSVARDVLSYFTPVSGAVDSVEIDRASVKLSSDAPVKKGVRFSVFREGEPFYHPVTKELIGKSEDYVGTIEVAGKLEGGLYPCSIINGSIQPGYPVRITSSKIKLAFFQDRKASWAMSELFYNTLKDSGRFDILEAYTSSYETDHLSGLARGLGADAVLMFSTPRKDGNKLLNAKLFWANDARVFADISEVAGSDIGEMIKPYEEFLVSAGAGLEPWGSYSMEKGQLIAMGDVDGSGDKEFVISDGNTLKVYSLKDELHEVWQIKGSNAGKHINIDILDANQNGVAEIFVTTVLNGELTSPAAKDDSINTLHADQQAVSSYVIEYGASEGYRIIADKLPYFMRVAGNTLLLQKYNDRTVFSSPVFKADLTDGQYKPGKALQLPGAVNIYGFSYIDWQISGQRYVVSFDDNAYLTMYDEQNNKVWKSGKSYGKFELTFKKTTRSVVNILKKWSVRSRLIPVKTERGQELIVVNRVPFVSNVPGLGAKEAEVYSLWWDGADMQEHLVLSGVSGTITDYFIEGTNLFLVAKGNLISFAKNAVSGDFVKGSLLYYYSFGKK